MPTVGDQNKRYALLLGLLLSVAVFYGATVRRGEFWPDDYALYIHHAENLAEGRAYTDTGYIYNRDIADYSPRAYPPVVPLLLAPVYRAFGLNLIAMKLEEVVFFLLALIVIAAYWRRDLDLPYLLALIGILGFSPHFWVAKDTVASDLPFLFFLYACALATETTPRNGPRWSVWATGVGALLYLCAGTRTVGLTVIPGFIVYDLAKTRKLTAFTITAVGVCIGMLLIQHGLIGSSEQSYADQLRPTVAGVISNLEEYSRSLTTLWTRSLGLTPSLLFFGITTVLALVGGYFHAKRGLRAVHVFLLFYLTAIILWPTQQGLRFLYPVIPFYVCLMLLGLSGLLDRLPRGYARVAFAAIILMVGLSYGARYKHANFRLIPQTEGLASFNQLCQFVRANTSPGDVFIFRRSRALSLFTSRPGAVYQTADEKRLVNYMQSIGATYIVTSHLFQEDRDFLIPFLQKYTSHVDQVYANEDFNLYRIRDHAVWSAAPALKPEPASLSVK